MGNVWKKRIRIKFCLKVFLFFFLVGEWDSPHSVFVGPLNRRAYMPVEPFEGFSQKGRFHVRRKTHVAFISMWHRSYKREGYQDKVSGCEARRGHWKESNVSGMLSRYGWHRSYLEVGYGEGMGGIIIPQKISVSVCSRSDVPPGACRGGSGVCLPGP